MSKKLPFISSDIPRDLRMFLERLRELVTGSGQERLVTAKELSDAGIASVDQAGNLTPSTTTTYYATPPAPTNLVVTAATRNIIVEWDAPLYEGHAYTEIWRNTTNTIGSAVRVGMSPGSTFTDPVGPGVTRYYWVRFVNVDSTPGAYNAVSGVSATTSAEVAYLLSTLTSQITSSQLASSLSTRIDLIDGPSTTVGTIPYQIANLQGQVDDLNDTPTYDNATTYNTDDLVKYDGGLYKALQTTTGNLPTNTTYWEKIGDYNSLADAVAAHSTDINTLTTDLSAETSARTTLASQIRGSYTGTDLALVTSGLIYDEKVARSTIATNLTSEVSAREGLAAQIRGNYTGNDLGAVTSGLIYSEREARVTAVSAVTSSVTTLDSQVNNATTGLPATRALLLTDYYTSAEVDTEIGTAVGAVSSAVTTLDAQVNNASTGLPATRSLLTTQYYTGATVDSAIASNAAFLRSYANLQSKTFRQASAPTKRGQDPQTAADVALQIGDLWIDSDDANKTYVWNGSAWVASTDTAAFDAWIAATYTPGQTSLQTQIDGKIESYFQTSDPSTAWEDQPTRDKHNGDLWYDTDAEVQKLKRYRASDNTWQDINDQTAIDAAEAAADAQSTADGKIVTFAQASAPTAEGVGDLWIDTDDSNKPYRWSGSAWVAIRDGTIATVDARVTNVEQTKIGYATRNATGLVFDNNGAIRTKADVDAWNLANPTDLLTWNVGLPFATAVKQVSVTDGQGNTAAIEQAFTTQKTVNDGLYAQYSVKIDNNGYVSGFGLSSTLVNSTPFSQFLIRADRFSIINPAANQKTVTAVTIVSSTILWGVSAHGLVVGDKVRFFNVTGFDNNLVTFTVTALFGSSFFYTDRQGYTPSISASSKVAKIAVPFVVDSGVVYIDTAMIKDATITNAKITNLAVDNAKIADATITGGKIANATITGSLIASSTITGALIADSTITTAKVADTLQSLNYSVDDKTGWQINKAGTATFNQVNVRGSIAGVDFTSYNWPTAGTYGFYLGAEGLRLGNLNNNKYFQVTYDGNVTAPGLTINNGAATFTGSLNVKSAESGARMEITNSTIKVYDSAGTLRVQIGDLA